MRCDEDKCSKAFTLIEILTSVSIILVLMVLLGGVIPRILESAHTTKCVSNLRQIGMDTLRFSADSNGDLSWYQASKGLNGMWWYRIYNPTKFDNFNQIMVCPSAKKPYKHRYPTNQELESTYRYNKYLGYQEPQGDWVYPKQALQTISQPSKIVLISDFVNKLADGADDSLGVESWKNVFDVNTGTDGHTTITNPHSSSVRANVVCVDGHIEQLRRAPEKNEAPYLNPVNLK